MQWCNLANQDSKRPLDLNARRFSSEWRYPNLKDVVPTPQAPLYKAEFLNLLKQLRIPVVDAHQAWSLLPEKTKSSYFSDVIHLTESGNQALADLLLFQQLCVQSKSDWCNEPTTKQ